MIRPNARNSLIVLMLLIMSFSAGCAAGEKRNYLTVREAWEQAKSLEGKQVRVRGYRSFYASFTAMLCVPARCDCNESWGGLVLVEEELQPEDYQKIYNLATITVSDDSLKCMGDECSMTCTPFEPRIASEFELVGTLRMEHVTLRLEKLDLAASRQRIDEKWIPIETGTFAGIPAAAVLSPGPTSTSSTGQGSEQRPNVWVTHGPGFANALVIDPKNPTTLYAGIHDGGVIKSTDGGLSWQVINDGLPVSNWTDLEIDPVTPSSMYAGSYPNTMNGVSTGGGVYKSMDGGMTWSAVNNGLTSLFVHDLAIDPKTPTTLYAATDGGGVYKSMNGGANWRNAVPGHQLAQLIEADDMFYVLAIDPVMTSTLYAVRGDGVVKSTDGGASWSLVNSGLESVSVQSLTVDVQTPSTLYAGAGKRVYKSTDGGRTWQALTVILDYSVARPVVIDPQNPSTLYAGTADGVYKSTNGGEKWSLAGKGLEFAMIGDLVIDPRDPTTLYATAGGDVYVIRKLK